MAPDSKLVDGSANLGAAERGNHPLDLPPVAEAEDIAGVAALLGERGSLEACIVAIAVEHVGSLGERETIGDEKRIHGSPLTRPVFRY